MPTLKTRWTNTPNDAFAHKWIIALGYHFCKHLLDLHRRNPNSLHLTSSWLFQYLSPKGRSLSGTVSQTYTHTKRDIQPLRASPGYFRRSKSVICASSLYSPSEFGDKFGSSIIHHACTAACGKVVWIGRQVFV